ncbi:MAG: hypothetical protein ACHQNE_08300, partial [Candidatus Kapaibacterium sp.]
MELAQYEALLAHAGLFDASRAFGRLFARGKEAIDLLHRMSTNDLKPLEQEKNIAALTFLTNEKGRMIDLLKVVRDGAGETLLITSAAKEETVIQWLDKFTIMEDAKFIRATESISQFAVWGPKAVEVLRHLDGVDLIDGVDVRGTRISET